MSVEIAAELDDMVHGRNAYGYSMGTYTQRITHFLSRNIVIPRSERADSEVTEHADYVAAGSGPERASSSTSVNPNWLRNRALNVLALADYLENRDAILAAKEAEAAAARDKRRAELANEFAPRDADLGPNWYMNVSPGLRRAIDHIIDMEDAAK